MVTKDQVIGALSAVVDPELGHNVVELGLIYDVRVHASGLVEVDATLTSMGCPLGPQMVAEMQQAVSTLPGVSEANVQLVWSPPWSPDRMSEELRWIFGR